MHSRPIVLHRLSLEEVHSGTDPTQQMRFACPISSTSGAQTLTIAYATLAAGGAIPWHYDSTEDEVLVVLEGEVEVTVQTPLDNETVEVPTGGVLHIVASKPHLVRNPGATIARIVQLFGHSAVTATFADPLMPMDARVLAYATPELHTADSP